MLESRDTPRTGKPPTVALAGGPPAPPRPTPQEGGLEFRTVVAALRRFFILLIFQDVSNSGPVPVPRTQAEGPSPGCAAPDLES